MTEIKIENYAEFNQIEKNIYYIITQLFVFYLIINILLFWVDDKNIKLVKERIVEEDSRTGKQLQGRETTAGQEDNSRTKRQQRDRKTTVGKDDHSRI